MCRKYTERMAYYVILNQSMYILCLFYSIYGLLIGNFDASKLPLPFNMAVPFDTNTTVGWYMLWILQFNSDFSYCSCVVAGSSYFVCCCIYILAIGDHFKYILQSKSNFIEKSPKTESSKILQIQKQLSEAIEIQVKGFE